MQALIDVILPVFLVIGFGYLAAWRGWMPPVAIDGVMRFAQGFAIPVLLFRAISSLDLAQEFDLRLLFSFYFGSVSGFVLGMLVTRFVFHRDWQDSVVIGFIALFTNALLLGLPITERAYGREALASNYAIIAIHAPFCYGLGITVMEIVRNRGHGVLNTSKSVLRAMFKNALVIGIGLGFVVNLSGVDLPGFLNDGTELIARAALPAALFGMGGILYRYHPEGDVRIILFISAVSLFFNPTVTWLMGTALALPEGAFRSAVLTSAMAPGINAYIFANMYGVARRVAASALLLSTAATIITAWGWLAVLG
ncbi:MAG: malonate transporter [Rhodobacterales bacterium]|nr:MAG: malonate transporter [Rhodobacterales bacterium]